MGNPSTLADLTVAPRGAADASNKGKSASSSSSSKRKSASLPSETVEYLKNWMMSAEHIAHPYPTEQEKTEIMKETGIELKQLTNWFVNNRKRYWKPRVEARLQHQASAVQAHAAAVAAVHAAQQAHQHQQVQVQHHHAATAAALGVVTIAAPPSLVNPVSPDTSFKTSQQLLLSPFVSFDTEKTSTMHQLLPQAQPHQVHPSPPAYPVFLTTSALAQRQVAPTPVVAAVVSETSSFGSVSGSEEEGDLSDDAGADEDDPIKNDYDRKVRISEMRAVSSSSSLTRFQTIVNESITNGARNVSFCSLEQVCGETSTQATEDTAIRTVETPFVASIIAAPRVTTPLFVAPSVQPKKRRHHYVVEDSPLADVTADEDVSANSSLSEPRKRFRRMSLESWIDACRSASDNKDEGLPSLEEATRLFGYCN